jgi:hypothetical protein
VAVLEERIALNDSDDSNKLLVSEAEFQALNEECLKRLELQQRIVEINLTIAAAFVGIALTKDTSPLIALVYIPIAMLLAMSWTRHNLFYKAQALYISRFREAQIPGLGWESWLSNSKYQRYKILGWFLTDGNIFLLAQIIAFYVGVSRSDIGTLSFNPLIIIDIVSILITIAITRNMIPMKFTDLD